MENEMRIELHSTACSCRGGAWAKAGEASSSPCSGGGGAKTATIGLDEWRTVGKPANLEQFRQAEVRAEKGERREFPRYEAALAVRIARIPTWRDPSTQSEDTTTEVVAMGGALVRTRMAVEKADVLSFEAGPGYKTRAEVMYVSPSATENVLRLGLRFLDAPLPDELIPAGATPLP
jgi:ribosomal protein L32E